MTISAATPATNIGLSPHALAQRVPCIICDASTGVSCVDADGLARLDAHHSRWIRYQHLMRDRPFTAVLRREVDDHLRSGDVVVCVSAQDGSGLDLLADGLGRKDARGPLDARDVEFQSFIEDTGLGARRRRLGRRPGRHVL